MSFAFHFSLLAAAALGPGFAFVASAGPVSLRESLLPSVVRDVRGRDSVLITGSAGGVEGGRVVLRVTTSAGQASEGGAVLKAGRFAARYPQDFPGAVLAPGLLYVDATDAAKLDGPDLLEHQAEATLILIDGGTRCLPDLPQVFTDDLLDVLGRGDEQAAQWPMVRTLTNRFMHSRGAKLASIGRWDFDLAKAADFAFFKDRLTLYDFEHRDRDWSQPLGNRGARGLWQAEWRTWFNASNNHAWSAEPRFRPYTFANDLADLLVLDQMRRCLTHACADHRDGLCGEVLENLLAMQHRGAGNFALREASGKQEHYTAGAFHYGLFTTGEWMTEGTGWFANPTFGDHRHGGVFNGRAVWALGESLKSEPQGPQAARTRESLALALRFCLHDAVALHYAREPAPGLVFWKDPGEHGYLLLGMLAACEAAPEMKARLADDLPERALRDVCADALDALVASLRPEGTWTVYPDQDAMAIAALAAGAKMLGTHPHRGRWLEAATHAADDWLTAEINTHERATPTPHFGYRRPGGMVFHPGREPQVHITLYIAGHWLQALARLHAVTGEARYAARWNALLGYLCGDNPLHARLFNELGAVYNSVRDTDGDGIEDELKWDAYPESTAFVQIGLLHGLKDGAWR